MQSAHSTHRDSAIVRPSHALTNFLAYSRSVRIVDLGYRNTLAMTSPLSSSGLLLFKLTVLVIDLAQHTKYLQRDSLSTVTRVTNSTYMFVLWWSRTPFACVTSIAMPQVLRRAEHSESAAV